MEKPQRRSIRLPDYDYSSPGAYFITLVTWKRENLFGEIIAGEMRENDIGFLVKNEWQRLSSRFPNIQIDEFVVMPNHLHGIICIIDNGHGVGARQKGDSMTNTRVFASPLPETASHPFTPPPSGSLGSIVGAFKSTTARLINGLSHTPGLPVWQRNYYEHIPRDEKDWQHIHAYIQANPTNWLIDEENLV